MAEIIGKLKSVIGIAPALGILVLFGLGIYLLTTAPEEQLMYGRPIAMTPEYAEENPLVITEGVGTINNVKYDFYFDEVKIGNGVSGGLNLLDVISLRPFAQSEVKIKLVYSELPDKTVGKHMLKIIDAVSGEVVAQKIIDIRT